MTRKASVKKGLACALLTVLNLQPLAAADLSAGYTPPAAPLLSLPFFLHIGPGAIFLNEGAKMKLAGAPVVWGSVKIDTRITAAIEAGYFVTPNIAVSVTGGIPPTYDIMGKGSVAGLGRLGKATNGPAALTVHYHFKNFGNFQPYVGAGPVALLVFGTKDGALSGLKVQNALGFAGQVGFDYMFDRNWGTFFDVKKAYLRTISSGTLGGLPVKAQTKLDPLVINTGVSYRF